MEQDSNARSKPPAHSLTRWEQVQLTAVWFLVATVFAVFIGLALQAK